jgi:hypothetical protein
MEVLMTPQNRRNGSLDMMPPPGLLKKPRSKKKPEEAEEDDEEERQAAIKIEIEVLLPDSLRKS